jgi:hypothetical protein
MFLFLADGRQCPVHNCRVGAYTRAASVAFARAYGRIARTAHSKRFRIRLRGEAGT